MSELHEDTDPGILWKLGQLAISLCSVAAVFLLFAYAGVFD